MPTELYSEEPGMRQSEVERKARAMSRMAGMFEKQIDWTGPGDVNVDPRMNAVLSGTGSAWDQSYVIQSITFVFNQPDGVTDNGGFTMTIEAANQNAGVQSELDGTTAQPGGGDEGDGAGAGATDLQSEQGFDERGFE